MHQKRFRYAIAFGLCALLMAPMAVAGKRLIIERIIAVVNGDIILWSEWKQRIEVFKARLGKTLDEDEQKKQLMQLSKQMLDKMIDDKLIEQQASQNSVALTEAEVKAAVKDTQTRYNMDDTQFQAALREQGYTMVSYKAMVRRELKKLRLLQQILRQKISISEEELKKYYADTVRGVKPGPNEYRVRQILLTVPAKASDALINQRKLEAENVLKLALTQSNLAGFIKLVRKFSQGPWKNKDGDLGFLEPESLPQAIAQIAKELKVDKVHPALLRTPLGFHVIFTEAIRTSGLLSYKEARPKIMKKLQGIAFQREYKRYVKELRGKAVIDVRVTLASAAKKK